MPVRTNSGQTFDRSQVHFSMANREKTARHDRFLSVMRINSGTDDGMITVRNDRESHTISLSSILDHNKVDAKTTLIADFDSMGVKFTIAGRDMNGTDGDYKDGDPD